VNEQSFSIRLHNSRKSPLNLFLEPWGEIHKLDPDQMIRIEASGPVGKSPDNVLEIESSEDSLTVWGSGGSGVTLHES
jgi:hypothetical protein